MATHALVGARIPGPTYDRSSVTAGIAHFGVGGFHRAHQAVYVDRLLAAGLGREWGICAIGALPRDRRIIETLRAQDGLYTVVVKHPDGRLEPRVVGSVVEALLAPDDPHAVVRRLADPGIRIVSLTITEGGYGLADRSPVFDLMARALALRLAAGFAPFAVVSCDNLQHNGALARRALLDAAAAMDPALAERIDADVSFPSSMVDRITPVTTAEDVERLATEFGVHDAWPVVCEEYAQWVLEDWFPAGRPPLEQVGVQLVHDVAPYEALKLRLLNGGHQVVAHLASLAGHRYVHEACQDPVFAALLGRYLEREATPTLPPVPGIDLPGYRRAVVRRFANPQVADTLARICADASDRIPPFVLPVVADNLRSGGEVEVCALAVAGWAVRCATADDLADREADALRAAARRTGDELAFLRQPALFGDLVEQERFTRPYAAALRSLREVGPRRTVEALLSGTAPA